MKNQSQEYYTPIQLKMPVDMEKMFSVDDPIYSFNEVLSHIALKRYFVEEDHKTGCPPYDREKLLKVVLFAFMEEGCVSTRRMKKLCRTDTAFSLLNCGKATLIGASFLRLGLFFTAPFVPIRDKAFDFLTDNKEVQNVQQNF